MSLTCSYLDTCGLQYVIPILPNIKAYPGCCRIMFPQEDESTVLQCIEEHTTVYQSTFACEKCYIYKIGKTKNAEEWAGIKINQ